MTHLNLSLLPFNAHTLPGGADAYIVGGTTRDLLLGHTPVDYDITVSGNPEKFARKIAKTTQGRLVVMGSPGKMVFRVVSGEQIYDITPFRGINIEADLHARDFTINAMAMNLASGNLIDPLNGRQDLAARKVRITSQNAFRDDPIRLLRAYRMAALLGFDISSDTKPIIDRDSRHIKQSAGERVREELLKIFSVPNSHRHIRHMCDSGLLFAVFPELMPLEGCTQNRHHSFDVLTHTLSAYKHLESLLKADPMLFSAPGAGRDALFEPVKTRLLKLAILLHDIGKPACRAENIDGNIHFYGHETASAAAAATICERLRCASIEKQFVLHVISRHVQPLNLYLLFQKKSLSKKAVTRFFMACGDNTPYLLLHVAADMFGKGPAGQNEMAPLTAFLQHLFNRFLSDYKIKRGHPPLLTGRDLITQFKLKPSPLFKKILNRVEIARLCGELQNRSAALSFVKAFLSAPVNEIRQISENDDRKNITS